MRQALFALLGCALALAAAIPAACAAPGSGEPAETAEGRLNWTIESDSKQRARGDVQLSLTRRTAGSTWIHSNTRPLAGLIGVTAAQLGSESRNPVSFVLDKEAGAFVCEGFARRWHGTGGCVFHANAGFASELADRGHGRPSDGQHFSLALYDIGRSYIDELVRQDYARPAVADLVRAGSHGANLEYLKAMGGHGYRAGTLAALIEMRDHGVTPDYVSKLARLGLGDLPAGEVVRLRDHGVSPEFVGEAARQGYRFATGDLIRLRDHGVTPDYLAELKALGYSGLSAEEIVRLRSHGVSADFIRRVNASGGTRRSAAELVSLRAGG